MIARLRVVFCRLFNRRRRNVTPIVERRRSRMTHNEANRRLMESVDRLTQAVGRNVK